MANGGFDAKVAHSLFWWCEKQIFDSLDLFCTTSRAFILSFPVGLTFAECHLQLSDLLAI